MEQLGIIFAIRIGMKNLSENFQDGIWQVKMNQFYELVVCHAYISIDGKMEQYEISWVVLLRRLRRCGGIGGEETEHCYRYISTVADGGHATVCNLGRRERINSRRMLSGRKRTNIPYSPVGVLKVARPLTRNGTNCDAC